MVPSFPTDMFAKADNLQAKFSTLTSSTASSCDLFGSIGTLVGEVTQKIVDAVTGAITSVRKAAGEVLSELKDKLSDCFGGSGEMLNKIKGYINNVKEFAADMSAKVNEFVGDIRTKFDKLSTALQNEFNSIMSTINSKITAVTDTIRTAIDSVVATFDSIKDAVVEVVQGLKQAACGAINSVLAGTPDDALANVTGSMPVLGAVKGAFNTGADSLKAVTSKVADAIDIGGTLDSAQGAAKNLMDSTSALMPNVNSINDSMTRLRQIMATTA